MIEEIDENEVKDLPNFLKQVLKTFGYCLLFPELGLFQEWYKAFVHLGFEVMRSLHTIFYDACKVPKRPVTVFSQVMTECELIAKAPSGHPEGFRPVFDSKFNLINCSGSRRQPAIDNVPFVKQKFTKKGKVHPTSCLRSSLSYFLRL